MRHGLLTQRAEPEQDWAYREYISDRRSPLLRATVVQRGPKRSNQIRVRIEGGEYPGLEHWVPRRRLIVPWAEAQAYLDDERRFAYLRTGRFGVEDDIARAMSMVFEAYPGPGAIDLDGLPQIVDLPKFAKACGLDPNDDVFGPPAFIDRHGDWWGTDDQGVSLAQLIAQRFNDLVLLRINETERELRKDMATSSRSFDVVPPEYYAEELADLMPALVIIRQWCGSDAVLRWDEIELQRAEIQRLRKLVEDAIERLRSSDRPRLAANLERSYLGDDYDHVIKERKRNARAIKRYQEDARPAETSEPPAAKQWHGSRW